MNISINFRSNKYDLELVFELYQSLLYKIEGNKIEKIDIGFNPEIPVLKKRPEDFEAPWLVN